MADDSDEARTIDLSKPLRKQDIRVTEESPAEQTARLKKEDDDACHQRRIEWAKIGALGISLMVIGAACLWLILASGTRDKTVEWAQGILTAIVTGSAGYLTGQKTSKKGTGD